MATREIVTDQNACSHTGAMPRAWKPHATDGGSVLFLDIQETVSVEEGESLQRFLRGFDVFELEWSVSRHQDVESSESSFNPST